MIWDYTTVCIERDIALLCHPRWTKKKWVPQALRIIYQCIPRLYFHWYQPRSSIWVWAETLGHLPPFYTIDRNTWDWKFYSNALVLSPESVTNWDIICTHVDVNWSRKTQLWSISAQRTQIWMYLSPSRPYLKYLPLHVC